MEMKLKAVLAPRLRPRRARDPRSARPPVGGRRPRRCGFACGRRRSTFDTLIIAGKVPDQAGLPLFARREFAGEGRESRRPDVPKLRPGDAAANIGSTGQRARKVAVAADRWSSCGTASSTSSAAGLIVTYGTHAYGPEDARNCARRDARGARARRRRRISRRSSSAS